MEGLMAHFRVAFAKVNGLEKNDLGIQDLDAGTLEEARKEAPTCTRPVGTNMIAIYREDQKIEVLGVEPNAQAALT